MVLRSTSNLMEKRTSYLIGLLECSSKARLWRHVTYADSPAYLKSSLSPIRSEGGGFFSLLGRASVPDVIWKVKHFVIIALFACLILAVHIKSDFFLEMSTNRGKRDSIMSTYSCRQWMWEAWVNVGSSSD